jgi:hypothetical protein
MCHQSVGLIQSIIEAAGIATVSITMLSEVTRKVDPPRALFVDAPLGYPCGPPHAPDEQRRIVRSALGLATRPARAGWIADCCPNYVA